ncbi:MULTISPECIES: alpha/beta hydrolase [unclassified Crossiella]|uniref:alpha/beta hydrolase n=1 Tax=unclassified Crossiella TaxID=2620835 RepID=UPI001FFF39A4|nr:MULTISPECIES: alpha/beta hydrolase [unclassified Crossiella]MCK2238975.1 alpha/beta hydrolase family protein [Crossiella sp. S99.2]MCK2251456.1 alpha/beta hydrolase family protein [Crossiella sp. S99.1]
MTTVEELRDAEPTVFIRAAQRWQGLADSMTGRSQETIYALRMLADWRGSAADTAKGQLRGHRTRLEELARGLTGIPPVLRGAGEQLTRLQTELRTALAQAQLYRLWVASDGQVDGDNYLSAPLTTTIRDILRQAAAVDAEAAAALRRLTQDATGVTPGGIPFCGHLKASIPAAGTSPAEVKKWWDGLSIPDRESLLATESARIGALDGIPVVVRDRANRVVLAELHASLSEEKTRLEAKTRRTSDDEDRLEELTKKLEGLGAVAKRLEPPNPQPSADGPAQQQAFLMGISADGNGRAIVAMGNPDTAANVATLVPGTESNLATGESYLQRADRMVAAARAAGSESTAVISWVGYDAPQNLAEAASTGYAAEGKQALARFQEGLRVTHEGQPSHNTVVGHSYGSTLVGHAARDLGVKADELVFIGSPGVGVNRADQLNISPEHVHASVADNDIINMANVPIPLGGGLGHPPVILDPHGPDPAAKAFGGKPFTSDPGTSNWGLPSLAAHMEYWEPGSKSLTNMGKIIAGQPTS